MKSFLSFGISFVFIAPFSHAFAFISQEGDFARKCNISLGGNGCQPGLLCMDDWCLCPSGAQQYDSKTSTCQGLAGAPCTGNNECVDGAECRDLGAGSRTCECKWNRIEERRGICSIKLGDACSPKKECEFGSICDTNTKRCSCQPGFEYGVCTRKKVVHCLIAANCKSMGEGVTCVNNECGCEYGQVLNPGIGRCEKPFGSRCIFDVGTVSSGSACAGGDLSYCEFDTQRCQCVVNAQYNKGRKRCECDYGFVKNTSGYMPKCTPSKI